MLIRLLPCVLSAVLSCAAAADAGPLAAPPGSDAAAQAATLMATGDNAAAIALLEPWVVDHPDDVLAKQTLMAARIAQLEAETRGILAQMADEKGLAVAAPDYTEAKARADRAVARRLDVVEYLLAQARLPEAVDACNAILRDYPHERATLCLKYRILGQLVERERNALLKEKEARRGMAINEVIREGAFPTEKARVPRTVWVFDEDIQEMERQAVKKKLQERVDLLYGPADGTQSVTLKEVLPVLFKVAGINYVILDSSLSEEPLTVHLVNASVEEALNTVAKLVKVKYNYSGGTVFVGGADTDVLITERIILGAGLTDVVTDPQLTDLQAGGGGGGGGAGGAPGGPGQPPQQGQQQGQNGQQAKSDLERFLDKIPDIIVDWPAEGKWYLDRKSNTLFVRATPTAIGELKRLLAALDYNNVQVLIETRFLEISDQAAQDLGINFEGGYQNQAITASGVSTGLVPPILGGSPAVGTPAVVGADGLAAQLLYTPNSALALKARISALETEGKADTLSEPKILTLNNALGVIEIRRDISYRSGFTTQSITTNQQVNNGTTTTPVIQPVTSSFAVPQYTKDFEGITLRIRPSVARNSDVVTLSLSPSVREIVRAATPEAFDVPSGNGNNASIQNTVDRPPEFNTRRLGTSLHIQNGQTVALGGWIQEKETTTVSGVPGLMRIPLFGRLFRRDQKSNDRRNLIILVTAHLIDPNGAKIGDEIRQLSQTARVVLPEDARAKLNERDAGDAKAKAATEAATTEAERQRVLDPVPRKGR